MTAPKAFAVIPAAGMGKRMGASINKQYLTLGGLPILARTLAVFNSSPLVSGICLVIPEDEIAYCREHIVTHGNFSKIMDIVSGGKERQNSVMNGLKRLQTVASDGDVVLIHDGVRPFVTEEMIRQSIQTALEGVGALVAVPVKDTIKSVSSGVVTGTPPRETLWQAQTPQSFLFGQILKAHQQAEQDGFTGTDDAALIERCGGQVRVVAGSYRNIKITTPEDLVLAEAFLKTPTAGV
ncbi:MAG TPA: 2-C-methyl-D-erythritol 4-phosphate cytidylyltransferase [Deltaproteobacteria bacterium]|nr:2-C-methyl-D-erythritol 4-phosphate cytidylyltransferase [Deltaproteobacteria bacterium]HQB37860.1 2-C-methyl-D-erythritol 4-phosphate cytidylyltransferase [Deltaproteobacteria bacterium]